MQLHRQFLWHIARWILAIEILAIALGSSGARAQIVPDRTVGSEVTTDGSTLTIDGGTQAGGNLFHSFSEFSVPTGNEAFFNSSPEIDRVLSRVTGDSISNIDGLIRTNPGASLFLMNPNGIVFGPNASLDIGGSFLATTGDRFTFANGAEFSATNPQAAPLLAVNVPIGLQMGNNPGEIVNRSVWRPSEGRSFNTANNPLGLTLNPGTTFALVGGSVRFENGNATPEGARVEMGAVGPGETVAIAPHEFGVALDYTSVATFGDILLSDDASLDTSNTAIRFGVPEFTSGTIRVFGRNIQIANGSILASRNNALDLAGGDIFMFAAREVEISEAHLANMGGLSLPLNSAIETVSASDRPGGDIEIVAPRVLLRNGGTIRSNTALSTDLGTETVIPTVGRGGNITIRARDRLELSGNPIFPNGTGAINEISTFTGTGGDAGDIRIETGRFILQDGSTVSVESSSIRTRTAGINFADGNGGTIAITASEGIQIEGVGTSATIEFDPKAMMPNIAPRSAISELSSASEGEGDAGAIVVTTPAVTLRDRGRIAVSSEGSGRAGNVELNVDRLTLEGSSIDATSLSGRGGNITLAISDRLLLREDSEISTQSGTATSGGGDGGNIRTQAVTVSNIEDSNINANAFAGNGGRIQIETEGLFVGPDSIIEASSALGVQGTVEISQPDVQPGEAIVKLPDNPLNASNNVAMGCSAMAQNRFTIVGRGGLPLSPNQLQVMSVWHDIRGLESGRVFSHRPSTPSDRGIDLPLVEARNWQRDEGGTISLVAGADYDRPSRSNCWQ